MAFVFGVRFRFNSACDTLFRRAIGISNSFALIIVLNVSLFLNFKFVSVGNFVCLI